MNGGLTCMYSELTLITNSTSVIKYAKTCHLAYAATWRACHNAAKLLFIVCDYTIFSEYVPSCG